MASQRSKENNPPVAKVRCNGATGNIYANKLKDSPVPLYKATFDRTYVDQGKFKTVTSYREQDLPYLIATAIQTWLKMVELKQKAWADSRSESDQQPEEDETTDE